MNNRVIKECALKKFKYTKEQMRIIRELQEAKDEWETSWNYFNQVNNPRLIDYAIYKQAAAKARYMYLLDEAKKNKIKINVSFLVENSKVI